MMLNHILFRPLSGVMVIAIVIIKEAHGQMLYSLVLRRPDLFNSHAVEKIGAPGDEASQMHVYICMKAVG